MSYYGLSRLIAIHATINSSRYRRILDAGFRPLVADVAPQDWMFQQDNATAHVAHDTHSYFLTPISVIFRGLRIPQTLITSRTYGESSSAMYTRTIRNIVLFKS